MWKPIDTAPKDTDVLVYTEGGTMAVASLPSFGDGDGIWQLVEYGSYAEDAELISHPTHWMELPEGPAKTAKEGFAAMGCAAEKFATKLQP